MIRFAVVIFTATCVLGFPSNLTFKGHGERVIGGNKAKPGQFPFQVELTSLLDGEHLCAGVILNERWVLTAAHCLIQPKSFKLIVGTTTLNSGGDTYPVDKLIVHEEYNKQSKQNDLGLIRSAMPIVFSDTVQPISLVDYELPDNEEVAVAGWGFTWWGTNSQISNDLEYIKVKIVNNSNCALRMIWYNVVTEDQLCTETKSGVGVCGGDSGGPLLHNGKLAGIVSWGVPCANGYPDIYVKISHYLDWINNNSK